MKKPVPVPPKGLYKSALANLREAYAIIKKPGRWTQNMFTQDCEGNELQDVRSPKAVAFCALGAVRFVNGPGEKKANLLLREAAKQILNEKGEGITRPAADDDIFQLNDKIDHKAARRDVLKMFQRAIKAAAQ